MADLENVGMGAFVAGYVHGCLHNLKDILKVRRLELQGTQETTVTLDSGIKLKVTVEVI